MESIKVDNQIKNIVRAGCKRTYEFLPAKTLDYYKWLMVCDIKKRKTATSFVF